MLVYSIVLLAAVVVAVGATENLSSDQVTEEAYSGLFTIGKHTYASQEDFIHSGKRCGTRDPSKEEIHEVEQELASMGGLKDEEKKTLLNIDAYFHVITDTSGNGALTQQEIEAQMDVLNAGFKQSRTKFILKGTTTTANDAWFNISPFTSEEKVMKAALRIGDASTLNIYSLANKDGFLGWAFFPFWIKNWGLVWDGAVVDYRSLPGGIAAPYNEGDTLTHEVGHWMGLLHTFQGGCDLTTGGDFVKDTPAVAAPNRGCPPDDTDSCPGNRGQLKGNDLVHNFMDYTDDACMWEFTNGQKDRMRLMWKLFRA